MKGILIETRQEKRNVRKRGDETGRECVKKNILNKTLHWMEVNKMNNVGREREQVSDIV